jgi:hypothetical protein
MIYRKKGSVARWENGTLIRVSECGVAREDGDFFECFPEPEGETLRAVDRQDVLPPRIAAALDRVREFSFERLIVTEGVAEHECEGRTWREETHRFHASLVRNRLRAMVDRIEDVEAIATALERAGAEREAPDRLRLAPNVSAAILPFLAEAKQTAGGVDGYGRPVTETSRSFYRPSYRVRPLCLPFNLRLEHEEAGVDESLPRAIALLAPADGLSVRVLIEEKTRVYPAVVRVAEIRAAARETVWYPYGAGSFGAEMML